MNDKIDLRENKRRYRKFFGIILIIFIFLIVLILKPFLDSTEPYKEELESVPSADKVFVRENEIINFTAEKCGGEIVSYKWDFGNGDSSTKKVTSYAYSNTGWYNVTLFIEDGSGNKDNESIKIGVQPNNIFKYEYVPKSLDIDPNSYLSTGISAQIGPYIDPPKINLFIDIYDLVGDCFINITIISYVSENSTIEKTIYSDSFNERGKDLYFYYSISQNSAPSITEKYKSIIEVTAMVEQGRWYYGELELKVFFYVPRILY